MFATDDSNLAISLTVVLVLGAWACAPADSGGDESAEAEMADPAEVTDPAMAGLPNPTSEVIIGFGPLPDEREWGSTAGVDIGPDGQLWAYDRCGGKRAHRRLRHLQRGSHPEV